MAEKKAKTQICSAISYHNGKPVSVTRFERVGNEFRPIEQVRYIDNNELLESREKVCKSIGRTASDLPSFQ